MKAVLNLEKVRAVKVYGLEEFNPKIVSLYVYFYDNEPGFEYRQGLTDLCEDSKEDIKKKVEKAYNDIKQALFNNKKYVEVEL